MKRFRLLPIAATLLSCIGLHSPSEAKDDPRPSVDTIEQVLVEQQAWLNNTIGITDRVPAPWTPLCVKEHGASRLSVDMLGRQYNYDINHSMLPTSLNVGDAQLLANPINLRVETTRGDSLIGEGIVVEENHATRVSLLSHGRSGPVHVIVRQVIEFDGMIKVTLTFGSADDTVELDHVRVEIPIARDHAHYLNHNHFYSDASGTAESLTMGKMPVLPLRSPFVPTMWLGDADVGLCWFAESDQGWDRSGELDAQVELFDTDDARVLRLNMIRSPRALDGQISITFGLLATPPKPLKPEWRTSPGLFTPIFRDFSWDKGGYYPTPKPELLESGEIYRHIEEEAWFKTSFTYAAATFLTGEIVPEYYVFSGIWQNLRRQDRERMENPAPPRLDFGPTRGGRYVNLYRASVMSSFTDWMLWRWERLIREYGIRTVYFDALGGENINRIQGAGYVDENGKLQPTIPIFAMREAIKRFYIMMDENLDDFAIMVHGGSAIPPILAFSHAHLSGEQFISGIRRVGKHYSDIVPEEEWIGYFHGQQFGVVGVFLPELTSRNARLEEPTREMMMLTHLYDIRPVAAYAHVGHIRHAQQAMVDYGMEGMRFVPYWKNDAYVEHDGDVKISLYVDDSSPGRVLLVVGNTSRQHQDVQIDMRISGLADHRVIARDLLYDEEIELRNGSFIAGVKQLDYRLISLDVVAPQAEADTK